MAAQSWGEKKLAGYSLFLRLKLPCPSYLSKSYHIITVMNGGLMTLTSTLFKGSRIKDGIWTCNNAGGVMVAEMASPSISVIVLLIRHWESCLSIISTPKGMESFLTPTDFFYLACGADKGEVYTLWPGNNMLQLK